MVAGPDVYRARAWGWRRSVALQTASATVSGALLGIVAAAVGMTLPPAARAVALFIVGAMAIVVGALEASGRILPVLQCDRETPQRWLRHPRTAAIKNGAALGCGLTTRIGFWSYFAIPLGALLVASPLLGGTVGATYAFVRSGAVLGWIAARQRRVARGQAPLDDQTWVLAHWNTARRIGGGWLVAFGALLALVAA